MLRGTRGHLLDRDDERGVADDPALAADHRRELREGSHAVLRVRLGHVALEELSLLATRAWPQERGDRLDVDPGVPELQVRHPGEVPDRLAIRPRHRQIDRPSLLGVEAAIAAGHVEARDEPLDVPFERARQGLVEVVDAEHEPPIRRGERAEVREVRVTAELHVEPGPGLVGEVRRHRVRRAAIERERRDQHPPVADRHQLGDAGRRLLLQQLDGIAPIVRRRPFAVRRSRGRGSRRLALGRALCGRRMWHALRRGPARAPRCARPGL